MFLYTNLHKTVKTMNAICKQKCTQILCIAFKMAIAIFQLTSKSDFLKNSFITLTTDGIWKLRHSGHNLRKQTTLAPYDQLNCHI